jgi:hypothetical protein
VIEYNDPRCAALGLHQRFHLGVINPTHLLFVEEIGDLRVVMHKAKALALEREMAGVSAAIVQDNLTGIGLAAAAPHIGNAGGADQCDGHGLGI